jgi:hypothetical protein
VAYFVQLALIIETMSTRWRLSLSSLVQGLLRTLLPVQVLISATKEGCGEGEFS